MTLMSVGAAAGVITLAAASLIAWPAAAAAAAQTPSNVISDVKLASVELGDVGSDSATLVVRLTAKANQSAVIQALALEEVSLNGVRISIPPVTRKIELKKGEPVDGLPDFEAKVVYQDLDSLAPIRRIVSEGKAELSGRVRARLQLNVFQKLALLAGDLWAVVELNEEVEVGLPGGFAGRAVALATLVAAEPIWQAGRAGRRILKRDGWRAAGDQAAAQAVVLLETRYRLKSRDGETAEMSHWSLGFQMGEAKRILAPAEAVEPWFFDQEVAQSLSKGDVKLDPGIDVVATLASTDPGKPGASFSLRKKSLRVVRVLKGSERGISPAKKHFEFRLRGSDQNVALLELRGFAGGPVLPPAPIDTSSDEPWRAAVIFRIRHEGAKRELEFLTTEVQLVEGRIALRVPVDSTSHGSPVVLDSRALGMLQDASSAVPASSMLRRFE